TLDLPNQKILLFDPNCRRLVAMLALDPKTHGAANRGVLQTFGVGDLGEPLIACHAWHQEHGNGVRRSTRYACRGRYGKLDRLSSLDSRSNVPPFRDLFAAGPDDEPTRLFCETAFLKFKTEPIGTDKGGCERFLVGRLEFRAVIENGCYLAGI